MTTKTETLFRITNYSLPCTVEPVPVHVGEFYRKVEQKIGSFGNTTNYMETYEKVTHVLPNEEIKPPKVDSNEYPWYRKYIDLKKSVEDHGFKIEDDGWGVSAKKETSDDYEYYKNVIDKGYFKLYLESEEKNKELQKKVEDLVSENKILNNLLDMNNLGKIKETIESQKRDIEKLVDVAEKHGWNGVENSKVLSVFFDNEIDLLKSELEKFRGFRDDREKLLKELGGLKSELAEMQTDRDVFAISNGRLEKELAEAKKGGVVWKEIGTPFNKNDNRAVIGCLFEGEKDVIRVNCKGFSVAIPFPPQPRTIDDEAEAAWDKSFAEKVDYKESLKEKNKAIFIEGFKAAKEGERE